MLLPEPEYSEHRQPFEPMGDARIARRVVEDQLSFLESLARSAAEAGRTCSIMYADMSAPTQAGKVAFELGMSPDAFEQAHPELAGNWGAAVWADDEDDARLAFIAGRFSRALPGDVNKVLVVFGRPTSPLPPLEPDDLDGAVRAIADAGVAPVYLRSATQERSAVADRAHVVRHRLHHVPPAAFRPQEQEVYELFGRPGGDASDGISLDECDPAFAVGDDEVLRTIAYLSFMVNVSRGEYIKGSVEEHGKLFDAYMRLVSGGALGLPKPPVDDGRARGDGLLGIVAGALVVTRDQTDTGYADGLMGLLREHREHEGRWRAFTEAHGVSTGMLRRMSPPDLEALDEMARSLGYATWMPPAPSWTRTAGRPAAEPVGRPELQPGPARPIAPAMEALVSGLFGKAAADAVRARPQLAVSSIYGRAPVAGVERMTSFPGFGDAGNVAGNGAPVQVPHGPAGVIVVSEPMGERLVGSLLSFAALHGELSGARWFLAVHVEPDVVDVDSAASATGAAEVIESALGEGSVLVLAECGDVDGRAALSADAFRGRYDVVGPDGSAAPSGGGHVTARDADGLVPGAASMLRACRDAHVLACLSEEFRPAWCQGCDAVTCLNRLAAFAFPGRYGLPGGAVPPLVGDMGAGDVGREPLDYMRGMFDDGLLGEVGVDARPDWLDGAREVIERARIWQGALEKHKMGLSLSGAFFADFEENRANAQRLAELIGIPGMLAAHDAGVPVDDLLA